MPPGRSIFHIRRMPARALGAALTPLAGGLALLLVLAGVVAALAAPKPEYHPKAPTALDRVAPFRRCLWVTRWDFRTAKDIERIFYNAASARFTDVMIQVRGAGTVAYPSKLEPWSADLCDGGPCKGIGSDPGWDPLATAVREGHKWGVRVHAYLNVLPGWSYDSAPPASTGQLYATHRSWFMVGKGGQRMTPGGWYAFLDPAVPDVRKHLAGLFGEVARNYEVDGVHLDYIRYPHEKGDFGYSSAMLEAFKALTGATPTLRPSEWAKFRGEQVTATVREISAAVRQARPSVELSAAVLADTGDLEATAGQYGRQWLREGLVDAIAPMNYTAKIDKFDSNCRNFIDPAIRSRVWLGIWADPKKNPHPEVQVKYAAKMGFGAVAVFAYSNLFPTHKASPRAQAVYQAFVRKAE